MHKPVLLHESIDGLNLEDGKVFVDATFGAGGHTKEVKGKFPGVRTISIDQDPGVGADITGNFRDIDTLLPDTQPDAILLDIGISSDQIDSSGRGFSFQIDEQLDMRMAEHELAPLDISNHDRPSRDNTRSKAETFPRQNPPGHQDIPGAPNCSQWGTRCFRARIRKIFRQAESRREARSHFIPFARRQDCKKLFQRQSYRK